MLEPATVQQPNDTIARELMIARYVSLATVRRDGREVRTPVWMASVRDHLYAFSAGGAGKVKRIRAQGRARLAVCTARGDLLGDWVSARARIVDDSATLAAAYLALRTKYGWQMWLLDCLSKLTGRFQQRALLEFELE